MDECQIIFGVEAGRRIREHLEGLLGEACPCYRDGRCPALGLPVANDAPV